MSKWALFIGTGQIEDYEVDHQEFVVYMNVGEEREYTMQGGIQGIFDTPHAARQRFNRIIQEMYENEVDEEDMPSGVIVEAPLNTSVDHWLWRDIVKIPGPSEIKYTSTLFKGLLQKGEISANATVKIV